MEDRTMKKVINNIIMGILLVAGVIFAACSSNEEDAIVKPTDSRQQVYTLTISAIKGSDNIMTRALDFDGASLVATWTTGDKVKVFNGTTELGELTATVDATDASKCTFSGTLTIIPSVGDNLTLKYLDGTKYATQEGTLSYIAANCDYAIASVTVNSVDTEANTISATDASFESQQAIVKFTLKKADGVALPSNPTALTISYGSNTITISSISASTYTTNGDGVLYVAIPGFSSETITFTATVGSDAYLYTKAGATFDNGKYYSGDVNMSRSTSANASLSGAGVNESDADDNGTNIW